MYKKGNDDQARQQKMFISAVSFSHNFCHGKFEFMIKSLVSWRISYPALEGTVLNAHKGG